MTLFPAFRSMFLSASKYSLLKLLSLLLGFVCLYKISHFLKECSFLFWKNWFSRRHPNLSLLHHIEVWKTLYPRPVHRWLLDVHESWARDGLLKYLNNVWLLLLDLWEIYLRLGFDHWVILGSLGDHFEICFWLSVLRCLVLLNVIYGAYHSCLVPAPCKLNRTASKQLFRLGSIKHPLSSSSSSRFRSWAYSLLLLISQVWRLIKPFIWISLVTKLHERFPFKI